MATDRRRPSGHPELQGDDVRDVLPDDRGHELGMVEASTILGLVVSLFGDVPMLSVRVERGTIPIAVPSLPWPRHVRSADVSVHCYRNEPAAEVANRLGLTLTGSRRFASERVGVEFVESTWAGWVTCPGAARLPLPVSVTLSGSHLEPTPLRRDLAGLAALGEAVG